MLPSLRAHARSQATSSDRTARCGNGPAPARQRSPCRMLGVTDRPWPGRRTARRRSSAALSPPVVMALGLPARQRPAVLDEGAGIEIADAADVGIERQEAAEAQHRRHLQLDHLLPVPARSSVEAAERARRNRSPTGPTTSMLGKRGRLVRSRRHIVARRHDQQLERLAVAPVLGQRFDQQPGAFKIAPALQLAQSQRQDGLADFGEHRGWLSKLYVGAGICHLSISTVRER